MHILSHWDIGDILALILIGWPHHKSNMIGQWYCTFCGKLGKIYLI